MRGRRRPLAVAVGTSGYGGIGGDIGGPVEYTQGGKVLRASSRRWGAKYAAPKRGKRRDRPQQRPSTALAASPVHRDGHHGIGAGPDHLRLHASAVALDAASPASARPLSAGPTHLHALHGLGGGYAAGSRYGAPFGPAGFGVRVPRHMNVVDMAASLRVPRGRGRAPAHQQGMRAGSSRRHVRRRPQSAAAHTRQRLAPTAVVARGYRTQPVEQAGAPGDGSSGAVAATALHAPASLPPPADVEEAAAVNDPAVPESPRQADADAEAHGQDTTDAWHVDEAVPSPDLAPSPEPHQPEPPRADRGDSHDGTGAGLPHRDDSGSPQPRQQLRASSAPGSPTLVPSAATAATAKYIMASPTPRSTLRVDSSSDALVHTSSFRIAPLRRSASGTSLLRGERGIGRTGSAQRLIRTASGISTATAASTRPVTPSALLRTVSSTAVHNDHALPEGVEPERYTVMPARPTLSRYHHVGGGVGSAAEHVPGSRARQAPEELHDDPGGDEVGPWDSPPRDGGSQLSPRHKPMSGEVCGPASVTCGMRLGKSHV